MGQANKERSKSSASITDALVAGGIALLLCIPVLAVKTVDQPGGLGLKANWWVAAVAFVVVFAGRYLLNLFGGSLKTALGEGLEIIASKLLPYSGYTDWVLPAAFTLVLLLPLLPFTDRYILDLSILILTYVMLGWGLNIVVGLAGLLDLGYVAFYAVGAYSFALLSLHFGLGFWICLPLAGMLAALWGIMLGFPVLRLRGDYLAIVTLAFGEIIRVVLQNWVSLTNGPDGISKIPRPTLFGLEFTPKGDWSFANFFGLSYSPMHRMTFLYYIILALVVLTYFVTKRLMTMPIGRAWEAMREDEIASRSLGINIVTTKLTAFAIGAMFGGFAGAFFATRQSYISPESFTFIESAIILAIVVLGGMGSQIGVAIAAVIMIGGFEIFRELDLYRMLIFGLAMVVIMVWRPRGLVSSRTPTIVLHEKKAISGTLVKEGQG